MFQPLDYMFLIMVGIYCIYLIFVFWNEYMRVKETSDDLVEKYVKLQNSKNGRKNG